MVRNKLVFIIGALIIGIVSTLAIIFGMVAADVINIEKTDIVFASGDLTAYYDGQEHKCEVYTIAEGKLLDGHTIIPTFYGSQTEVGTNENKMFVAIVDENGADCSEYYNIGYRFGSINVVKAPLSVTSKSENKTYDGIALEGKEGDYEISSDSVLAPTHRIVDTYSNTITNVGEVDNQIFIKVLDENNNDVSANYDIKTYFGKLRILPRNITLASASDDKIYDGTPLFANGDDDWVKKEGSLVKDDYIKVVNDSFIKDCGEVDNVFTATVYDKNNNDVSSNYNITYLYGKLRIGIAHLIIETKSASKVYDGTPLTFEEFEVISGSTGSNSLALTFGPGLTDVDIIDNSATYAIFNESGDDVTVNYIVDITFGTLTVTKRPLLFSTLGASKTYDGTPLVGQSSDLKLESGTLPDGDSIIGFSTASITDAGFISNVFNPQVLNSEGETITYNFDIQFSTLGTLTVTPRPITLHTGSVSKQYDNTSLDGGDVTLTAGTLGEGDVLNAHTTPLSGNAYSRENSIGSVNLIVKGNGTDSTSNYNITYDLGTISILPLSLKVRSNGGTKEYDGTPLTVSSYTIDYGTLFDYGDGNFDTINAFYYGSQTEVGISTNACLFTILNPLGQDVSTNYTLDIATFGELEVTPCVLKLRTASASKIYDGDLLTSSDANTLANGMWEYISSSNRPIDGDTLVPTLESSIRNVGTVDNAVIDFHVTNAIGDVTTNYTVIVVDQGTLTIEKRPLAIESANAEKLYDGTPLTNPIANIVPSTTPLPSGHTMSVTVSGSQLSIGNSPNTIAEIIIRNGAGNIVTSNFDITKSEGTLSVVFSQASASPSQADDEADPFDLVEVTSTVDGYIYLRSASYANYTGKTFTAGSEYPSLLEDKYSYNYLLSYALENSSYSQDEVEINYLVEDVIGYTIPTASVPDNTAYTTQMSDTIYGGDIDAAYTVPFYMYDYLTDITPSLHSDYSVAEASYYSFVRDHYLGVPQTTKTFLEGIISANSLEKATEKETIAAVVDYVSHAAQYTKSYNKALLTADDMVIAFLRDYKEGVCVQYAQAATLILRTLDIPARYCEGILCLAKANETVTVTNEKLHAWTEVYIQGLGWVQIDATGFAATDTADLTPAEIAYLDGRIINPIDTYYQLEAGDFTTTTYPSNQLRGLSVLLNKGYTYKHVIVSGEQQGIGSSLTTLERLVILNPNGQVVFDSNKPTDGDFTLTLGNGKIQNYVSELSVETGAIVNAPYTGSAIANKELILSNGVLSTTIIESNGTTHQPAAGILLDGHHVDFTGTYTTGSVTNVGVAANNYTICIRDSEDNDVTNWYMINSTYGLLNVVKRPITVTADDLINIGATLPHTGGYTVTTYTYSMGDLISGHILSADVYGHVGENGGVSDVVVQSVTIYDSEHNDVTNNYIITTVNGSIVVV